MSYAILRTAKLKTIGAIAASGHHTFRERDTSNADAERTDLNVAIGAENTVDLLDAVRERLPEKHRKDAVLCLEYLISASPDWFGDDWREKKNHGTKYFSDALDWLKEKHGAENVVCANVQLDESTPHMAVYVVPRLADGRLSAKEFVGGRAKLTAMQTDFAKVVGKAHGLERGIEGSKATHTKVKSYYKGVSADFEPLPEVKTIPPKLRPAPEKPRMFAGKDAKAAYEKDYEAWHLEKVVAERLLQQRQTEVKAQRDVAVATAKRHEAQARESKVLKAENKQLKQSNGALTKRLAMLNFELVKAQQVAQMFTPEEVAVAQSRAKEMEVQRVRQAEMARKVQVLRDAQAKIESEAEKRVKGIQKLLQQGGAGHTFAVTACEALRKVDNDPSKVDWRAVEAITVRESLGKHRQSAESVVEALTRHSPRRADPDSHRAARSLVERVENELAAEKLRQPTPSKDRGGPSPGGRG